MAGPGRVFATPSSGNVFTYSFAPRWHVDQGHHGVCASRHRLSSGRSQCAARPRAPPDAPREYGADKTVNIELGVRSTQLDGRLSIDVAAFHVDWKDIQLFEVVDNIGINTNGGKARSQGVEWTFAYVPVHGLTFDWTGAYTDAKLTSDAPAVNGK